MSHEWNPITTAPKDKPILVTDDESVWFGRISAAAAVFDGANLQDGSSIWMDLDDLTGWLPAPKTMWEPQKTADEQFRELGYRKIYVNEQVGYYYENRRAKEYIDVGWQFQKYDEKENLLAFEPSEILACAQLIREKEVEEDG